MKKDAKQHQISKLTRLAFKRETIIILTTSQLRHIAAASGAGTSCSTNDPMCDPTH